jgi:MarR family transcriptional regulator, transcriptional regulator for hemolysin
MVEPNKHSRTARLQLLGMQLSVLERGYRSTVDRSVAQFGLSQAQAWPLVMVGRAGGGVRIGVVADMLAMDSASMVRPLEQLAEAGLIDRMQDPDDRRAKVLILTKAGEELWAKLESVLSARRLELFDGISDDDVDACLRVFSTLQGRVGKGATQLPQHEPV